MNLERELIDEYSYCAGCASVVAQMLINDTLDDAMDSHEEDCKCGCHKYDLGSRK
jgi:hypothetical protein